MFTGLFVPPGTSVQMPSVRLVDVRINRLPATSVNHVTGWARQRPMALRVVGRIDLMLQHALAPVSEQAFGQFIEITPCNSLRRNAAPAGQNAPGCECQRGGAKGHGLQELSAVVRGHNL